MDRYDRTILEGYIDKFGLTGIMSELASICGEKSEHIAHSWQDAHLALQWTRFAVILDQATAKLEKDDAKTNRQTGISGIHSGCAPNYGLIPED